MVGTHTRTAFQSELQAQKKAATWQSQQLSIAERRKKAQIAVHGRNFIQSVEELKAIVSENYGQLFEHDFWDDLVVKATAALKTPNEQTLGLFAAKVTYLTETLQQYPISNAIRAECVRENETISWRNFLRNYRVIETSICPELFCIPITCGGLI